MAEERIPLTVCPLSNVKLCVFESMQQHSLRRMMEADLLVTVNSDDPPYFGGYVAENLLAVQQEFGLSKADVSQLACNSFQASFLEKQEKRDHLREVEVFVNGA